LLAKNRKMTSQSKYSIGDNELTLLSIDTLLEQKAFETIELNGAFAHNEQMLHFPLCFQLFKMFSSRLGVTSS